MGRRETTEQREARKARNKGKRDKTQDVSARGVMRQNALNRARDRKLKAFAEVHAKVLVEISSKYYDGDVKYCALRPVDQKVGNKMMVEINDAIRPYMERPKSEQTTQLMQEAGEIVREKNQAWINSGMLVPHNITVGNPPMARIYGNGRVEAVNRAKDMDVLDMGRRYREYTRDL